MKLKSLFLASLAAIALVSCNNEEEATINGGEVDTKEAIVQFGISFSAPTTRATTADDPESGIPAEQNFTDATIVINQGTSKNVLTFPFNQFSSPEGTGTHQPAILWLKEKISVTEGPANVYVFLNASAALKNELNSKAVTAYSADLIASVNFSEGINALEGTGMIAETNKFLMCNANGQAETPTFTANTTNSLTVCVGRVAAKLEEKTPADNSFDVTDDAVNLADKNITVHLSHFAYAGLQQTTYVLKSTTPITANLYAPYNGTTPFSYQEINGALSNYCMENLAGANIETTTNIIYKGNITIEGTTPGTSIYITPDNYAFTSVTEMAESGYIFEGLTEKTSVLDCWNTFYLRKYENGVCYYVGQIETVGSGAKIYRNNIYRLSVNSIKGFGTVLPVIFDDPTLLDLTVEIDPWTVNLNSFDF